MKRTSWIRAGGPLRVAAFAFALALQTRAASLNTANIEELTGLKGTMNDAEGVFKVTKPRDDVKVSVDGGLMPPLLGLTSWAAFPE
jgi:hypothetical protein